MGEVSPEKFRDPKKHNDLKDILIYHTNPVVRHEASFVIRALGLAADFMPWLISVIKFDQSLVAKHEAAETLGAVNGPDAVMAYRFLRKITTNGGAGYDDGVGTPDVQVTALGAMQELQKEIAKLPKRQQDLAYAR